MGHQMNDMTVAKASRRLAGLDGAAGRRRCCRCRRRRRRRRRSAALLCRPDLLACALLLQVCCCCLHLKSLLPFTHSPRRPGTCCTSPPCPASSPSSTSSSAAWATAPSRLASSAACARWCAALNELCRDAVQLAGMPLLAGLQMVGQPCCLAVFCEAAL